jgi:hypothetical protein
MMDQENVRNLVIGRGNRSWLDGDPLGTRIDGIEDSSHGNGMHLSMAIMIVCKHSMGLCFSFVICDGSGIICRKEGLVIFEVSQISAAAPMWLSNPKGKGPTGRLICG